MSLLGFIGSGQVNDLSAELLHLYLSWPIFEIYTGVHYTVLSIFHQLTEMYNTDLFFNKLVCSAFSICIFFFTVGHGRRRYCGSFPSTNWRILKPCDSSSLILGTFRDSEVPGHFYLITKWSFPLCPAKSYICKAFIELISCFCNTCCCAVLPTFSQEAPISIQCFLHSKLHGN